MKTIKLMLEYGAWPLWILDEKEQVIDTILPPEFKDDQIMESQLDKLQSLYESCFINNEEEFKFIGFKDDKNKIEFNTLINVIVNKVKLLCEGKYNFVDNLTKMHQLKELKY